MTFSPIVLFTYNRPFHTRKTIEALQKNRLAAQSDLIIFSDGPKEGIPDQPVQEVRDYLKTIEHFKSVRIIERKKKLRSVGQYRGRCSASYIRIWKGDRTGR